MSSYRKPETGCSQSLLESEMSSTTNVSSVDDILQIIGWKNKRILIAFLLTSCCWIFTALNVLTESFINDPQCDFQKLKILTKNSTIKINEYKNSSILSDEEYCISRMNDSMISELELYGERNFLKHSLTTFFMMGCILGGPVISFISDKYGRKFVVVFNLFLLSACNCFILLADSIFVVLLLRLLQGFSYMGCGISGWILSYESIPPILRPIATLTFGLAWVVGYCAVAPLAFYIKNWKFYMFAPGIPCLFYAILCLLFVPESLHFLVHNNQMDKAKEWVEKVSGKEFADNLDWNIIVKNSHQNEDKHYSILMSIRTLFTNKKLLIRVGIVAFIWATDVFVYFGMSMFTVVLAGDRYFNFVAVGLVEIVSYVIGPVMLDKLGRRWTISSTHIITAICFLIACIILKTQPVIELILWLIAKFAISTAFMGLFSFAVEAFPTSERNFCIGICAVCSKMVGLFSTEIQHTVALWGALPLAVFGSLSFLSGILTLTMPETSHTQLPDSTKNM